ncbi:hypothetical protein COW36_01190 [bacterium (Candidatus Blackallbacteria) CG17_big_fil_post_rev_8_21_14_2_50_48_46]|uniref:Uncharacterized protein n=1 Tax=bacterium (Candidatus Blackallbacteria) CG17_big_fil_post_rev_8_21_14_2_50_48_46 TaxID=2014261 RepID=A0A2M7GC13_9BACT|nr:MAG: hypothetical protein COW64_09985 [bacterium (Candidatus Blackallbacteria) CG18_big_fil_WC_8_21_14_2_50_49_26]PIW19483.1 MAG: hypothetical protein COW36_01190 [bacterium (Candidatus Blackallbacteria) CG17_big_fil_post_rev_8_21_14_2_50_48_46]PIW48913.1 MAG: hypothetical protein COW20_07265 [bacterium (Candidatus Blackallbacteria) CG13_big_fil_rev_8_21_14_2_50_49_14]
MPKKKKTHTPLEALQAPLNLVGFETFLLPKSSETPYSQLLVALTPEPSETESSACSILQIFYTKDVIESQESQVESGLSVLQFLCTLPDPLSEALLPEAWRLCTFFSQLMPMGGFQITPENRIYYRYCHMHTDPQLKPELLVEIVELISLFLTCFEHTQQQLGKIPLSELQLKAQTELLSSAV